MASGLCGHGGFRQLGHRRSQCRCVRPVTKRLGLQASRSRRQSGRGYHEGTTSVATRRVIQVAFAGGSRPDALPPLPKNIAKNFTGTFFRENGRCLVHAEAERLRDQVCCSLDVELYCTSSVADFLALCSYKPRLKLGRAPSSAWLMLATFGARLRAKRRGKTATAEPRTLEETTAKP